MPSFTQYQEGLVANTNRWPSELIWANAPILETIHTGRGHYHFNDFISMDAQATATYSGQYYFLGDDGVLCAPLANTDGGVIEVSGNDADNDMSLLVYGFEAGFARFSNIDKVWFECRVAKASIADNALGMFVGFTEPENIALADVTLMDDDAILDPSEDFIGFNQLLTDADSTLSVYQEGGAAVQATAIDVPTAAGYDKLGLTWDGRVLKFFVNGQHIIANDVTVTSALSFPDANHLSLLWGTEVGEAAESKAQMDWWRVLSISEEAPS